MGMAGWLTRKFDCPLWMTKMEYLNCRVLAADTGREAPADAIRFYRRAGWGDAAIEDYRARFGKFGQFIHALPESYRRIRDGEVRRDDVVFLWDRLGHRYPPGFSARRRLPACHDRPRSPSRRDTSG